LDVFGFDAVFLVDAFFLGDVEGHVGKRQGRETDADFRWALRPLGYPCNEQDGGEEETPSKCSFLARTGFLALTLPSPKAGEGKNERTTG
jgi:hypothetical protein